MLMTRNSLGGLWPFSGLFPSVDAAIALSSFAFGPPSFSSITMVVQVICSIRNILSCRGVADMMVYLFDGWDGDGGVLYEGGGGCLSWTV